jgi:Xaa-Pro aminopeptidase
VYDNQTAQLWMNKSQLSSGALNQLSTVDIRPYTSFLSDLYALANNNGISTFWTTSSASQAIFSRIPAQKRLISSKFNFLYAKITTKNHLGSPVEVTKAIKNPIEEQGMRACGIRDGVARVRHLAWLEDQLNANIFINETKSAEELERFQSEEALFRTLSFDSISAFGPNAAIIHYSPNAKTAAQITKNGLYLLDAGAQYLDCTTDVTRTHVFGTATQEQKKAYTLVLQGKSLI